MHRSAVQAIARLNDMNNNDTIVTLGSYDSTQIVKSNPSTYVTISGIQWDKFFIHHIVPRQTIAYTLFVHHQAHTVRNVFTNLGDSQSNRITFDRPHAGRDWSAEVEIIAAM